MKNKKKKLLTTHYSLQTSRGFTLIELLLVIAIIGILAAVMMVSLNNQRARSRGSAALQSIRSAMPYVAECYLKNDAVVAPANGGNVCNPNSGVVYPDLSASNSTAGCAYAGGGGGGNAAIVVSCNGGAQVITCDYAGAGGVSCQTNF